MVSTEYLLLTGGVGRYTSNLTKSLQKLGLKVNVIWELFWYLAWK
jgi:hypothetical protein